MPYLSTFTVPVEFISNTIDISAIDFVMEYDDSCLTFDAITGVNTGLPDSVTEVPAPFAVNSTVQELTAGDLTALIKPPSATPPLSTLDDGTIMAFEFGVQAGCTNATGITETVTFTFTNDVFSDDGSNVVSGLALSGTYTLTFNATPTDIDLTSFIVDENQPAGTTVGILSSTDLDIALVGDAHTYSLYNTAAYTDNVAFAIDGTLLKTDAIFNYEVRDQYTITIKSEDSYGAWYTETLNIDINDLNDAPTEIKLDTTTITENLDIGTVVGLFTTIDEDLGDSHTYTLTVGALDNDQFDIDGTTNELKTEASFDYETTPSLNIQVVSTDTAGSAITQTFTIDIIDINEAPVAVDDPDVGETLVVVGGDSLNIAVLANDTDQDGGTTLTVDAVGIASPLVGTVTDNDSDVTYVAPSGINGVDTFTYTVSDGVLTDTATVSVTVVTDTGDRGDCNQDGAINAADFPALVLEIFDTDESLSWWHAYTGGFAGSPLGCDANAGENGVLKDKESVDAADITCTVLVFFGDTACTAPLVQAASVQAAASLSVGTLTAAPGASIDVPVVLDGAENTVASATFALDFDASVLTLDEADTDGDGIPDTLNFVKPANMTASVQVEDGRIEVVLYGTSLPLPLLEDGTIATVSLQVSADASGAHALTLDATKASLGNDQGKNIETEANDGSVEIAVVVETSAGPEIFLPIMLR